MSASVRITLKKMRKRRSKKWTNAQKGLIRARGKTKSLRKVENYPIVAQPQRNSTPLLPMLCFSSKVDGGFNKGRKSCNGEEGQ